MGVKRKRPQVASRAQRPKGKERKLNDQFEPTEASPLPDNFAIAPASSSQLVLEKRAKCVGHREVVAVGMGEVARTTRKNAVGSLDVTSTPTAGTSSMLPAQSIDVNNSNLYSIGGNQYNNYVTNIFNSNPDPDQERQTIARWLSPLNFKASQSEFLQQRAKGTGQWLLESQDSKDWRDGKSETLWCSGNPGTGKTILASMVINHLQTFFRDADIAILCIYCNYKEQSTQTVSNLIASLLKQMVQDRSSTSDNIKSFYQRHRIHDTRPTLDELAKVLEWESDTYSKVFIIVDALDECSEDNGTRANLLKVLRSLTGTTNLMVTSRDLPSIAGEFQGTKRLDIRADNDDVRIYVEGRIACAPRRHLKALQGTIVNKIIENIGGMFLLARLHMDSLVGKHNIAAVRKALQMLPKEMDDSYDEAMERIERQSKDDKELAKQVFSWVTHARRPLSVKELQHALAVMPGMTAIDPESIIDEEILTSVCAGLVVIGEERSIVRLVHYTTQEYFERKRYSLFPSAEAEITAICLTYLSFDVFGRGYCDSDQEFDSLFEENALLDYAARHWGHHARGDVDEINKGLALQYLQDNSKIACASQVLLVDTRYRNIGFQDEAYSQLFPKGFSGMHISCFLGLEKIIDAQLEYGAKPDLKDSDGRTPLSFAAENGHEAVVKLLLARDDVDVNSRDKYGRTPLLFAVENRRHEVVKLLLARDDVNVHLGDADGRTPLTFATLFFFTRNGIKETMNLMSTWDNTNVGSTAGDSQTPLSDERVKQLLAQDGVDPNSNPQYHGSVVRLNLL